MTEIPDVTGLELEDALAAVKSCGLNARVQLCSSKKGVPDANSRRVICQRAESDGVLLIAGDFKCGIDLQNYRREY